MSSPFNPLSALTPAPGLTPLQLGPSLGPPLSLGEGLASGVSPHPFLQPSPGVSPAIGGTPWLQLVGLGGPTATPTNFNLNIPSLQGLQSSSAGTGPSAQAAADADDTIRAIPDICRILERAEAVSAEIALLEKNLFVTGEGAERAGVLCRLEALQLDYAQTLFGLISLCSTYLVGALPVNLAAVTESAASTAVPPSVPTTVELAAWTEARAQTMFARREAVRNATKAVGDVMKGTK